MTGKMRTRTSVSVHSTPPDLFEEIKKKYGLESTFNDDATTEWIRLDVSEAQTKITWFKNMDYIPE